MVDDSVPIIDISGYRYGTPAEKRRIAAEIDLACRTVGFLVVAGHGVPEQVVDRADRATRAYFDLPAATKLRHLPANDGVYRGYHALESNAIAYSLDDRNAPPDLFERFAIGPVDVDKNDPFYTRTEMARAAYGPNIWPKEAAGFAKAMTDYYRAMDGLALSLMRLFAIGLGLDEFWFDRSVDKHMTQLVIQNYPDQEKPPRPGQLRCGPHSDYGSLTILKSENKPGGLEVQSKAGAWTPVHIIPGTFIVNLGDLMAQWTNDRWVSTMHRVVNPPRDKATGSRRISLVFFQTPNYDAMVDCLESCRDPAQGAKYPPITAGDHLISKFVKQTTFGEGVA